VKIEFAGGRLERCFRNESRAVREWGQHVGLRYIQRIQVLAAATSLDELRGSRALRLHPLRGDRRGEWAMTLAGRWRLTFEAVDEQTVRIKEVSAHYGD
jgi:proteic killer suppression protein